MDEIKRAIFDQIWLKFPCDPSSEEFAIFVDNLYSSRVLNDNETHYLRNNHNDRLKLKEYLKRIILQKGNDGYKHYIASLEHSYKWLFELSNDLKKDMNLRESKYQDALILGDVPSNPANYIERTQLLNEIQNLINENAGKKINIVLHGMHGSGKSSLAAAIVRNRDLISRNFNNKVFWINAGKLDQNELLNTMYRLYLKIIRSDEDLKDVCTKKPDFNDINENLKHMRDQLIILFRKESYKRTLLILDNVSSSNEKDFVISSFKTGCNMVITTQERNIIQQEEGIDFFYVADGFTEEESLKYFAKSLKSNYETIKNLEGPTSLHRCCKGDPMMISLLAATIEPVKERILSHPDQWNFYINLLNKKDYDIVNKRFQTISICYDNIPPDLKSKYQDFALFVEDINVMPQILQTLWNMKREEVEKIMHDLQNISLIVSYYNKELESYIYGIHHVLLTFLKNLFSEKDLILKHEQLINAYKRVSGDNYANLPNDNYIYQYIGYHLREAKMFDQFSLYFDLNFIGAKIRATGIADLIRDFKVYEQYITKNDSTLKEKLEMYKIFVETYGEDLYNYKDTDIVQTGLKLCKDHPIYKEALQIAKSRSPGLYFQMHAPHKSHYYTHTLSVPNGINAACFTNVTTDILVGTNAGQIELWDQTFNTNTKTFNGHTNAITAFVLNKETNEFISVSQDGTVKLWNLGNAKSISNGNGLLFDKDGYNQLIPSPSLKQKGHQTFFGTDNGIDRSKTLQIEGDALISASFSNDYEENKMIVTGSLSGKVYVWKNMHDLEILLEICTKPTGNPVNCVSFSDDDGLVIATCGTNIGFYNVKNGEFVSNFFNKIAINALHVMPNDEDNDNCLIARHNSSLTMWNWNQEFGQNDSIVIKNIKPCEFISSGEKDHAAEFVCSTITDTLLVVGSSDSRIIMWDIYTGKIVDEFFNKDRKVVSLDASRDGDGTSNLHILLSGFDDKTVKLWHVRPNYEEVKQVKNLPIFATSWHKQIPLIAIANTDHKIEILKKHNSLAETKEIKSSITSITFSICGNKMYYGLQNGLVHEFIIKTKHDKTIMNLESPVTFLKCLEEFGEMDFRNGNCNGYAPNQILEKFALVAFSETGTFFIYRNEVATAKLIIKSVDNNTPLNLNRVKPIKDCFFIKSIGKLLTVGANRSIKLWSLNNETNHNFKGSGEFLDVEYVPKGDCRVLFGEKKADTEVSMVALSLDQSFLGITMVDGSFEIYMFEHNDVVFKYCQGKTFKEQVPLTSCCFSYDKRYFAIGCEDGNIMIWNLIENRLYVNLKLHRNVVRKLMFSPSEYILVSIGEEIVWWDLKNIPADLMPKTSFRRRSNSARKSLTIEINNTLSFQLMNLTLWNNKIGPSSTKPHVLSTIKLHGSYANNITASQDFTSFLTVDNQGEIYNMEILENS